MKILRIPLVIVLVVMAGRTFHANAQTVTILYSFGGYPNDGSEPQAGLVQGGDGDFYGTTSEGGTYKHGTVFRISPSGTETTLYSFAGSPNDGSYPSAGLVEGSDSNFYGTTYAGGENATCSPPGYGPGCGTVFRISPSGTETTLYSFGSSPNDGIGPLAALVQGSDGNFYGTTCLGGMNYDIDNEAYDYGCVFRISPGGNETVLYSFAGYSAGDGEQPQAVLVQGSDSNFYGTASAGGPCDYSEDGCGTVFRISPSGKETTLYQFGSFPNDGQAPYAGLVQGNDDNLYGTTERGGTWSGTWTYCDGGCGTVFRISPSGTCTTLYLFGNAPNDGDALFAGLVQGRDGNFYGTTGGGGAHGDGTVFRISPSGTYTTLYSFGSSPIDGVAPYAGLVQGSDSNFYGTTRSGGTSTNCYAYGGCGTVFKLDVGLSACGVGPSISPTNAAFGIAGGSGSVNVTASNNCAWTATSNAGFITITSGTNGTGNGTVYYSVVANTTTTPLTGTMTIANKIFTVTQAGLPCSVSPDTTSASFGAAGGSNNVAVTANGTNCTWTASSSDWYITIASGSSGSGNGTVDYKVATNTSASVRIGTMTVAGQKFTVTQSGTSGGGGTNCTCTLSATSVTLPAKGGSKNVSVKVKGSDCFWTAVSNDPFITITSGSSGTGNGKVVYSVPGNTNTVPLVGTMTIAGQTFTVNQAAGGCKLTLSPKAGKLKATGGSATVKVKANLSDCAWTAESNDSFITITAGAGGVGNGTVSYSVAANTNITALTGSLTIGGQTFPITQAGAK